MSNQNTSLGQILIVDDEEPVRECSAEMLRRLGFQTITAGDCEAGLRAFMKDKFKLVILDWRMPRRPGLAAEPGAGEELAKILRGISNYMYYNVKIWLVSGDHPELPEFVDDKIDKPFNISTVKGKLENLVGQPLTFSTE